MNQPTNRDWTIRAATSIDAESVAQIYNHYVAVGGATFDTDRWTMSQAIAYIESQLPDVWLIVESPMQALGWASVRRYSLRGGYRWTCETAIYVAPSAIGTGVADALQQRIDDHCRQHELHHAVAKIIADNHRSIAFHRRHGYEMVGIQKEIGRINDQWADVAIMQKVYR